MSSYATLEDVITLSGRTYDTSEAARITALLPLVSDALRVKAKAVGKDLNAMTESNASYANLVKLVTVDVVARVMRQSTTGEPMAQESQAAGGYSWSGTYAIPGGGVANAIMRNDLKALGLMRQKRGVIDLCPDYQE